MNKKRIQQIKVNKKRLINEFFRLVKIDSISGEEDEICLYLQKRFINLATIVKKDDFSNLVVRVRGKGKPLILSVHMDTVEPGRNIKPYIEQGKIIKSRGKTILGADNKSALSVIIELLQIIKEENLPHKSLEIIVTREEENISRGAKHLNFNLLKGKQALVLDSATPLGTITLAAAGVIQYNIEIFGRLAHVKEPEKGINAIKCAANIISKIPNGKIDNSTTLNTSFIKGGIREGEIFISENKRNSIPDYVRFGGEIRGFNNKKLKKVIQKIKNIYNIEVKKFKIKSKSKFSIKKLTTSYQFKKSNLLIKKIAQSFKKIGIKPQYIYSLGGSDANVFNQKGIKTIVVSSAQRNTHSVNEYVVIDELVMLVSFLINLVTIKNCSNN